jgi:hypothetical protein
MKVKNNLRQTPLDCCVMNGRLDFLARIWVEHLQDDTILTFMTNINEAALSRILENVKMGASTAISASANPVKTAALYFSAFRTRANSAQIIQHELRAIQVHFDQMISRLMQVVCKLENENTFLRTIQSDAENVFGSGSVLDVALRSQNMNLIAFPKMMRLVDRVWYSDLALVSGDR